MILRKKILFFISVRPFDFSPDLKNFFKNVFIDYKKKKRRMLEMLIKLISNLQNFELFSF